jgi:hypothetical protein
MSDCTDVERAIAEHGLLLLQDKTALDVVSMLAGEKLSTSWWGHAAGQKIFACLERLDDDPGVLATRLVAGKITYLHRRLWPAFLAIAQSRASWQMNGLSAQASRMLESVKKAGLRATGPAAKELQERLLVHAEQVHTEKGRHETQLETWSRAQKTRDVVAVTDLAAARAAIEAAVLAIGASVSSLPWAPTSKGITRSRNRE